MENGNNSITGHAADAALEIKAESFVELSNEKIALVFYEIVRNRIQHVNSWAIMAPALCAAFQLVNKSGIEVYRKAQPGDFMKIVSSERHGSATRFDWVRIEAIRDATPQTDVESFGFQVKPSFTPSVSRLNELHSYNQETAIRFLVSRVDAKVVASVFLVGQPLPTPPNFLLENNGAMTPGTQTVLDRLLWSALTDSFITR